MPVVTYNYSGPLSGALALELLAKLQDTELVVSVAADAKPTLTVVTNNPIVGSSSTSSSESWAVCAKALSSLIPSLRFWDEGVEQWIHSAAIILGRCRAIATLSRHDGDNKRLQFLTFFFGPSLYLFIFCFDR